MTRRVRIDGKDLGVDAADFQARLASAFFRREHPLCLCCAKGVAMYIARFENRHILKRMPGTGPQHDQDCDSYEPPYELSGLGHLGDGVIQENTKDGTTNLKLDFSLSKTADRAAPTPGDASEPGEVRTEGGKLSMRGLLHYLWDQAQVNRWRPAMARKRNWAVIRKFLIEAATGKATRKKPLSDVLYIPEMFNSEREAEIVERRTAFINRVLRSGGKSRPLAVLIGEVKEFEAARFGHRMVVRHAPKYPFMLAEDAHRRMTSRFAAELALWNANTDAHLVAIATFGLDLAGIAAIDAISLMVVDENWLPVETIEDVELLAALTRRGASFVKTLRYNLPSSEPLATVVLRQQDAQPIALYVVPPEADSKVRATIDAVIAGSSVAAWIWDAGKGAMPELPR
ncbi:DUF1173 domain-containing protein [Neorhizobium sp. DT-125]|uniref:DUF1173 domain-containing protein n=1 Tax=Neorhizobium sp. DT-125 TaxID=3396163 RepID=UPI003F1AE81D